MIHNEPSISVTQHETVAHYHKRIAPNAHIIHRIHLRLAGVPDDQLDGPALEEFFSDPQLGTGGKPPYHFILRPNGNIIQFAAVSEQTPHARAWNRRSIATAIVGDPRTEPLTVEQYWVLRHWCALWRPLLSELLGHSSADGGSSDPDKICPGSHANLDDVLIYVAKSPTAQIPMSMAMTLLEDSGVRF